MLIRKYHKKAPKWHNLDRPIQGMLCGVAENRPATRLEETLL